MLLIVVWTVIIFHVLVVSSAFPRVLTSDYSQAPTPVTLQARQTITVGSCSCSTGCTGCPGVCCTAGQVCASGLPKANVDMCCTGNLCTGFATTTSRSTSTGRSSTSPATSRTPTPQASPQKSPSATARIAGGAAAGGVAAVGAGILVAFNLVHIKYLLGVLMSMLFGFFVFRTRRIVFSIDDNLPTTQICLFLTPRREISDATDGNSNIVVWKVFNIGNAQDQIEVAVPQIDLNIPTTYGAGVPEIGFGSVDDSSGPSAPSITCLMFEKAPAILEEGTWTPDLDSRQPRLATIRGVGASRFAVGTIDSEKTYFNPFLLVESAAFQNSQYQAEGDLYLHVFRSHGYSAGMYGPNLVSTLQGDNLHPQGGIKIKDLRPLTSWHISSAGDGKLRLEISANRKEDIKKFKHDCVIKKDAQAQK